MSVRLCANLFYQMYVSRKHLNALHIHSSTRLCMHLDTKDLLDIIIIDTNTNEAFKNMCKYIATAAVAAMFVPNLLSIACFLSLVFLLHIEKQRQHNPEKTKTAYNWLIGYRNNNSREKTFCFGAFRMQWRDHTHVFYSIYRKYTKILYAHIQIASIYAKPVTNIRHSFEKFRGNLIKLFK